MQKKKRKKLPLSLCSVGKIRLWRAGEGCGAGGEEIVGAMLSSVDVECFAAVLDFVFLLFVVTLCKRPCKHLLSRLLPDAAVQEMLQVA